MELILRLHLQQFWNNIYLTRKYISNILQEQKFNKEIINKIEVALTELMENACKNSYVNWIIVELERDLMNSCFFINVKNMTKNENLNEFKKILSLIDEKDPLSSYKDMMIRNCKNNDKKLSQLGLARIIYECSAKIDYFINKNNDFNFISSDIYTDYVQLDVRVKIPI